MAAYAATSSAGRISTAFTDLPILQSSGLLDPSFYHAITQSSKMSYQVVYGNTNDVPPAPFFTATATRKNSGRWTGALSLTEQGVMSGNIQGPGGHPVISPPSY